MMSEPPELRASDADRERVAEVLRDAVAEGRLTMEEFDERLDAVYRARTYAELEPLTRDLPVGGGAGTLAARTPGEPAAAGTAGEVSWPSRIGGTPSSKWALGVLGGFQRGGRWVAPRRFTAVTVMGGGQIDLREARFEDREIVIRCFAVMGGVNVVVPPGMGLDVRGFGLMGGFDQSKVDEGDPGAPKVVVTGFAFWGGVGTERKLPKEERRRLKAERKRRELEEKREKDGGGGRLEKREQGELEG